MSPLFYAVGSSDLILRCKITKYFSYMQINNEKSHRRYPLIAPKRINMRDSIPRNSKKKHSAGATSAFILYRAGPRRL